MRDSSNEKLKIRDIILVKKIGFNYSALFLFFAHPNIRNKNKIDIYCDSILITLY
ncbi:hypothetical protein NMYAN_110120 [Nitrosomonas nitrosa]|uniref:Uncharacterized protein n=1 Tax=Nitrosomonas nitrosa TaxID=52442 RepID=A0A8H8YXM4_9PROT|nr:hypothetical protein NMYAN_110120 [Nitrosomonas nitrosa]